MLKILKKYSNTIIQHFSSNLNGLNEKTRQNIIAQDLNSEKIIVYFNIVFIFFVGVIYFISPKGFSEGSFQPVPIALAIYLAVLVARLYILLKIKTANSWLAYSSIIIDISIIAILIWSFHLQYQQQPAFYLKTTTFTYFFVAISLRTLRFNSKAVLFSTLVVVFWWIALTIYAANVQGEYATSFVDYTLNNKILIGAEVDKLIAVILVGFFLATSIGYARFLLVKAEKEATDLNTVAKFFSPSVSKKILSDDRYNSSGIAEIKEGSIMVTDLRKFSSISQTIEPKNVMEILSSYHSVVVPIILKNNGNIDKFLGDGILINFGTAINDPLHALNALKTAEELVVALNDWRQSIFKDKQICLDYGIAVDSGSIIFGTVGEKNRLEFTSIGNPVNAAAKLENYNKIIKTRFVTTQQTFNLATQQGFKPKLSFIQLAKQNIFGLKGLLDLAAIEIKAVDNIPKDRLEEIKNSYLGNTNQ